jgi:hypothetical protein
MEVRQQRHADEGDAKHHRECNPVLADREDRHILREGRLELASFAIKQIPLLKCVR